MVMPSVFGVSRRSGYRKLPGRASYGSPMSTLPAVGPGVGGAPPANPWSAVQLPQYAPGHPAYQAPQGAQTLPQRPGMPVQGPMQYSQRGSYMQGQPTPQPGPLAGVSGGGRMQDGRPMVYPGSGMVYAYGSEYEPSPQQRALDNASISGIRSQDAAAGSGPYDNALGRFQSLAGPQERPLTPPPVGTVFGGGSIVTANSGTVGPGGGDPLANTAIARNRAGGNVAYRNTGGQTYTPEQLEQNRQNAIAGQADRRQMLAAGRNIRANQRYGAPLRPDLFPRAEAAYAPDATGFSPLASANRTVNALVSRNTTANEDGTTETNWGNVTRSLYDDPKFKGNPQAAWENIRKSGMTSADIAAMIDSAEGGWYGIGADSDPAFIAWLQGLGRAAGIQGTATAPGYAPTGPLGAPGVLGQGGQYAPPLPRDSRVVQPPPSVFSHPDDEDERGLPRQYAPPPVTPRRRPGPGIRPSF